MFHSPPYREEKFSLRLIGLAYSSKINRFEKEWTLNWVLNISSKK